MRRNGRALMTAIAICATFAVACSRSATTTQPSTVPQIQPRFGVPATGGPPCEASFNYSPSSVTVSGQGGDAFVSFYSIPPGATTANCSPMAIVSNAPFITVASSSINIGGDPPNSSVRLVVAPNEASIPRSGTVTIGDKTATINQERGQLTVSLSLFDPARTSAATTECDIRGPLNQPTTCIVQASVAASGGPSVVSYAWVVDVASQRFTQTGGSSQISFSSHCGLQFSTPDGSDDLLNVSLTVTDSAGNSVVVPNPQFRARLFSCGS